jgi:hypothetical protein
MKVVKFNPDTPEGQQIAQSYLQGQPGQPQTAEVTLDPVVLNDASYNRYLPLKGEFHCVYLHTGFKTEDQKCSSLNTSFKIENQRCFSLHTSFKTEKSKMFFLAY